jgi:hypothetical protein
MDNSLTEQYEAVATLYQEQHGKRPPAGAILPVFTMDLTLEKRVQMIYEARCLAEYIVDAFLGFFAGNITPMTHLAPQAEGDNTA